MSKDIIPQTWPNELSAQPNAVGARNLAGGSTACRNPFDLPTIYSTGMAAQPSIPRRDIYPDSFGGDDRWQNVLEKGNKDVLPITSQQPLWSSIASQSIASTQPIGSKPNTAATISAHQISNWSTDPAALQICNGGSPVSINNMRPRDLNYEEQDYPTKTQAAASHYQSSAFVGLRSTSENVMPKQAVTNTGDGYGKLGSFNLPMIQPNSSTNIPFCMACCGESLNPNNRNPVTSRCRDCNEDLCDACVGAHQRVKITRDHTIVRYPPSKTTSGLSLNVATSVGAPESLILDEGNNNKGLPIRNFGSKVISSSTPDGTTTGTLSSTPNTNSPPSTAPLISLQTGISKIDPYLEVNGHTKMVPYRDGSKSGNAHVADTNMQHSTAQNDAMRVFADVVEKAKNDCDKLLDRAKQEMRQVDESQRLVTEMGNKVDQRYNMLQKEIKTTTQQHITAIKEREQYLLNRLDRVRQVKLKTLEQQQSDLALTSMRLGKAADELVISGQSGRELDLYNSCNKAMDIVRDIQGRPGTLSVQEDDVIDYVPPDTSIFTTLNGNAFGVVCGSGYAPSSHAEGDGLSKAILGKDAQFIVVIKDQLNEQRPDGGDPLNINIASPDGRPVMHKIFDGQNGVYRVSWKPNIEGEHTLAITLKSLHVRNSPFKVNVRSGRNYFQDGDNMLFEFGTEGENDGQLCRPWGVCCSREGYILVANRSNNRIEVYKKDGQFKHKFGTTGKLKGQFDRPASVFCDRGNRAIIADKDNHRIQIFTVEGEYLMDFGEKGQKNGQFNYPWDVACNSKDQILVSDTRNHRIQLFTPNGEFIAKYGFEGAHWKHFDSPRGVCFTADDKAVVTDFNNHRLLVVKSDLNTAQFLGKEGTEDGMFMRPNGVTVDDEGNFIVADSRNDRVQIFSSSGVFIKKFGTKGNGPGEFDRPSGVCVSPEGLIIVVDFGNNRVQVF